MGASSTNADQAYIDRQRRWKQSQTERTSSTVTRTREAVAAAIERIVAVGEPSPYNGKIIDRYENARTLFGREYVIPVYGEDVQLWVWEELTNLWTLGILPNNTTYIGLDNNIYQRRESLKRGKNRQYYSGLHVLDDATLAALIERFWNYTVDELVESLDKICASKPSTEKRD